MLKPDLSICDGDFLNGKSVSIHVKNLFTTPTVREEFDAGAKAVDEINEAMPNARKIIVKGNHDFWLVKHMWANPELTGLLDYNKELGLEGWEVFEYGQSFEFNKFVFTHGNIARKHSGYSARGMGERYGCSGMSGHTHRGGSSYFTNYSGTNAWYENFCLCNFKLSEEWFHEPSPNWQHGFSVIQFFDNYKFHVDQIPIPEQDKFAYFQGKTYTL